MSVQSQLLEKRARCLDQQLWVGALTDTRVSLERLRWLAKRHYAEVRTFIDLKLPCRIRLCPHGATIPQRYFWELYREEQGNFVPDRNHADLFLPVCTALGLEQAELLEEFSLHSRSFTSLLTEEASWTAVTRELAISFAWEGFAPAFGTKILSSLQRVYSLPPDSLEYFRVHNEVDAVHSQRAEAALVASATDANRLAVALRAIEESLLSQNPYTP